MVMPVPQPDNPSMHVPASDRWTAVDLDHLPENGLRYEVLNGQLVVNAAPKPIHQWMVRELVRVLELAVPEGHFVMLGVGVLIGEDEPIPDLMVCTGPIPWDGRGIPAEQVKLVVEVVSRSKAVTDRLVKHGLYAEGGIPNYWRIETRRFKRQLPEETLPVIFGHVLADNGEYEGLYRISAGHAVTIRHPFELTIDPAILMP